MKRPLKRETQYINTDLELIAPCDLTPLAEALAQRGLIVLHVSDTQYEDGSWFAIFETEEQFPEPDRNIAAMLTAIGTLDAPSRSLWEACTIRRFDLGYDCGEEPGTFIQQIGTATIAGIAAVGAAIVMTLYGVPKNTYKGRKASLRIFKS